jgi:hypothetical protein
MKPETKSTMEVLMVLILLAWALTFTLPGSQTPAHTPTQTTPRQAVMIQGVSLSSDSNALIDYFADGVWREEQETIFENIDQTFTPYTINNEPVVTSHF